MATLPVVRKAFMDALSDPVIPGLTAYRVMTSTLLYPCVIPVPSPADTADYTKAFQRGIVTWNYSLMVLVGGVDGEIAQDKLDQLIDISGPMSIPNVLYNNRDLGLANVDVAVLGVESYLVRFGNMHVGASLKVRVITTGTG